MAAPSTSPTEPRIKLYLDERLPHEPVLDLFAFLHGFHLAPPGTEIVLEGPAADQNLPSTDPFVIAQADPAHTYNLEIAFCDERIQRNAKLLKPGSVPKLMVGPRSLPQQEFRALVPFQGRLVASEWLRIILARARELQWTPQLVHCDQGLVTKEIYRMAQWFHLDVVKQSLLSWLDEEMRERLGDLVAVYPEVEVRSGVGSLTQLLENEPGRLVMMGCLLKQHPHGLRQHGIDYAKLLAATGGSGYFVAG